MTQIDLLHYVCICTYVPARNLFKRVHNEIHNVKKGGEALPSQVLQVVAEGRPAHKGLSKAQRAQCPLVGVYLIYGVDYGMD